MWIFAVILLEFLFVCGLVWAFAYLDEPLKQWENDQAARIKNAVLKTVYHICERVHWHTRKIRRDLCAKLLSKDGVTVQSIPATERDLNEAFNEVMRLLHE